MTVPYRPLGHIAEVLQKIGLEVTYAYDDLVYVSHSAFILQMSEEKNEDVLLFINVESEEDARDELMKQITDAAAGSGLNFINSGMYKMSQAEDEQIRLEFFPK